MPAGKIKNFRQKVFRPPGRRPPDLMYRDRQGVALPGRKIKQSDLELRNPRPHAFSSSTFDYNSFKINQTIMLGKFRFRCFYNAKPQSDDLAAKDICTQIKQICNMQKTKSSSEGRLVKFNHQHLYSN